MITFENGRGAEFLSPRLVVCSPTMNFTHFRIDLSIYDEQRSYLIFEERGPDSLNRANAQLVDQSTVSRNFHRYSLPVNENDSVSMFHEIKHH